MFFQALDVHFAAHNRSGRTSGQIQKTVTNRGFNNADPIFDKEGAYVHGVVSEGWENEEGSKKIQLWVDAATLDGHRKRLEGSSASIFQPSRPQDGGLPGNIEDRFRPRRRKPIGFISCCWIGIGIAVGCQRPSGILFRAWRTQGCLVPVHRLGGGGRSLNERWRVTRPFAGDRKCSVGAADGDNRDRSQHFGGHAISHVSATNLAPHIGRCRINAWCCPVKG
jgi:hypothetical protein